MTYNNETGTVEPRSKEEWLNLILQDGADYWGEEITERRTAIYYLFEPYADRLAELEEMLQDVQESLRVDTAEGQELNYIGEKLGVIRREAQKATGSVNFISSSTVDKDYLIPEGTVIRTSGIDPVEFETTEPVELSSGTSSVIAPIEARKEGSQGNVAAGSINTLLDTLGGIDEVNNPNETANGRDKEKDNNYRQRIKTTVGDIEVTSLKKIYNELNNKYFVEQVRPIDNSTDEVQTNLDPHQVEIVIDAEPGHQKEIAQTIFDNIPMGADLVNGKNGDPKNGIATLPNGQEFTINYSTPVTIPVYIDVEVELEKEIDQQIIKDSIIQYIGGEKTNGQQIYGDLSVSDDVLLGEVEYSIRDVNKVYDVTTLNIGTSSSPTGTSNISIGSNERAVISPSNITITSV